LIERGEAGEEARITGTSVRVSELLWWLGAGGHREDFSVIDLGRSRPEGERALTAEDIRAAAAYGAQLARDRTLSKPATLALQEALDALRVLVGSTTVEEAAAAAPKVLDDRAQGMSAGAMSERDPRHTRQVVAAATWYAAYLARDQHRRPIGESGDRRALREPLGEADRRAIEDYGVYLGAQGLRGTPEELLTEWREFVEQIETGFRDAAEGDELLQASYGDPSEQYENRLFGRDHLGKMMVMISPSGQEHWRRLIDPWDQRFEGATEPIADPPWYPGRSWWWRRVPKRLGDLAGWFSV
jgi:uncharacterized protein (DUF433 family)